ncbi:putative protein, chloroplastic [Sesamum angolense]|uniref:Uncharacterized protein n=1 Tax=Sesamum angolense TaxID=2727404 RepID=A0AAE1X974_9LAMI|nr:putative protein, chloroplastic [Sesamum angolense]
MSRVTAASLQSCSVSSPPRTPSSRILRHRSAVDPTASAHHRPPLFSSNLKLGLHQFPRINLSCSCSGDSDYPKKVYDDLRRQQKTHFVGENESKAILDAFFLGKAVAEAVNERIESAVGEFLSTIGRLQAEQQKQVQEFQEDVLEKARRAKEQAAREAMEAQGLIPKSSAVEISTVNGVASAAASTSGAVASVDSSLELKPPVEDPNEE